MYCKTLARHRRPSVSVEVLHLLRWHGFWLVLGLILTKLDAKMVSTWLLDAAGHAQDGLEELQQAPKWNLAAPKWL